jgi:hypothetical protein
MAVCSALSETIFLSSSLEELAGAKTWGEKKESIVCLGCLAGRFEAVPSDFLFLEVEAAGIATQGDGSFAGEVSTRSSCTRDRGSLLIDYIISTAFSPSSLLQGLLSLQSLLKVFFGRISGDGPLESDSFIRITLCSALPHYRAPVVARIYSQWRRENSDNKESIQFHFGFTRHFV